MSKEHITYLKTGGYLRVTEYTPKESRAEENRLQRVWMKKEGLLNIQESDIKGMYKDQHPYNTDTDVVQYAPSYSLKDRLRVFLRNRGILYYMGWEL